MSDESFRSFAQEVQVNPELFATLREARAAATVEVGAAAGFKFTVEDVRAAIDEASSELRDDQLESVAGGLVQMPFAIDTDPSELTQPPKPPEPAD